MKLLLKGATSVASSRGVGTREAEYPERSEVIAVTSLVQRLASRLSLPDDIWAVNSPQPDCLCLSPQTALRQTLNHCGAYFS